MENTLKYSIVVPCYNSEILETLCEQVYEAFEKDLNCTGK